MSQSKFCTVSLVDDFFVILVDESSKERIFVPKDKYTLKVVIGERLEVIRDERRGGYIFKQLM
ncbi:hypothetical protein ACFO0S_12615 [Chryseomicrobium palamuruense]|uniref:DUF3006 domain-containing protein n=1 Tax=Chryseomicrobium palamuruense TaxID=682973 RepID=A0ABV8UX50_9BACL